MNARLEERIRSLRQEAAQLKGLLVDITQAGASLPAADQLVEVSDRLRPVFARMLDPLQHELQGLDARSAHGAETWRKVDELAEGLQRIGTELLPVVHGSLARAAGIDRGLCSLAQNLLDELGRMTESWDRVVIPAAREATHTSTWVVGLPLRDATFWSLPIMVHELGHYSVTRLRDQHNRLLGGPLLDGAWRERPTGEQRDPPGTIPYQHANELFSDVFATYCMGPSYLAALVARANPLAAWDALQHHPSWGARVRAVLRTTRVLEERSVGLRDELSWVTTWIADEWARSCADMGSGTGSTSVAAKVDTFTDAALTVLDATASEAMMRGGGMLELGEQLRRGASPSCDADLRLVLNAAWAERLRPPGHRAKVESAIDAWRRGVVAHLGKTR